MLASPTDQPRNDIVQQFHISSKTYKSPDEPSYVVLVMPNNRNAPGTYYRVNDIGLELLRRGWTPEKIGLDPLEEDNNV